MTHPLQTREIMLDYVLLVWYGLVMLGTSRCTSLHSIGTTLSRSLTMSHCLSMWYVHQCDTYILALRQLHAAWMSWCHLWGLVCSVRGWNRTLLASTWFWSESSRTSRSTKSNNTNTAFQIPFKHHSDTIKQHQIHHQSNTLQLVTRETSWTCGFCPGQTWPAFSCLLGQLHLNTSKQQLVP